MNISALAFDTGDTVLDWHGGLVAAMSAVGTVHHLAPDWHEVVNDWRRRAMKGIVGQTQPALNMDDVPPARWMALQPAQILIVACHNFDLNAAHQAGFRTAFVRLPDEWVSAGPPHPNPNIDYDFVVDEFASLAQTVLSAHH